MKMAEVQKRAKKVGVKAGRMKKKDLIRAIQEREGNRSCFQAGIMDCDQFKCSWREDCRPLH